MSNKETERCFARACKWNTEEGCEKPVDAPCPLLWWSTGNLAAGKGIDMRVKWKKATA